MSTVNRYIFFTAASVQIGFGLEIQSVAISTVGPTADEARFKKVMVEGAASQALRRMKWEFSTSDSSCGIGRLTKSVHGRGFALEPKEVSVVTTMAVFFSEESNCTGTLKAKQTALHPTVPSHAANGPA